MGAFATAGGGVMYMKVIRRGKPANVVTLTRNWGKKTSNKPYKCALVPPIALYDKKTAA